MMPDGSEKIDIALATTDRVELPEFTQSGVRVESLRLDKIHPVVSGNKWFKLKEHLRIAVEEQHSGIVTFGGALSNHIVATAYAARQTGLPVTGIIRGGDTGPWSDALEAAAGYGMHLEFISRGEYRKKEEPEFLKRISALCPGCYILPEGGGGPAGVKGIEEIGRMAGKGPYSHILCAIGTGTMFMGLARAAAPHQKIIGVPVLKGLHHFMAGCRDRVTDAGQLARCRIEDGYHFGGYARRSEELLSFMRRLYACSGIPTDFVYTGKLFYAVSDLAKKGVFPPGSVLLVIHSGGLQGNRSLPAETLGF